MLAGAAGSGVSSLRVQPVRRTGAAQAIAAAPRVLRRSKAARSLRFEFIVCSVRWKCVSQTLFVSLSKINSTFRHQLFCISEQMDKYQEMRAFVAVVEAGSFVAAADALRLS